MPEPGGKTGAPAASEPPSASVPAGATPAPTAAPRIPANADEAVYMYEGYPVGYTPVNRSPERANSPIPEPRYTLGSDGVYHSSVSTNDNEASIMFTGDLMCQTRQQEACK